MTRRDVLLRESIRVVVLDDDPTGIQTVQGCLVLTEWSLENLATALQDAEPFFYILTNSRAFPPDAVRERIRTIVRRIFEANRPLGCRLVFVSRSDSTLRSHFPLELDTLVETSGIRPDARFLIPAFFEGGRTTVGDTHYILQDGVRVPCQDTEFARDLTFGYSTAHLPGYIEEKTGGRIPARSVSSIPVDLLREDGQEDLDTVLKGLRGDRYVVVNAETYEDLDRFSTAVVERLSRGDVFCFQSAASLVKSLVECPTAPLVGRDAASGRGPGLIVVGSHVERTTRQVSVLLEAPRLEPIEIDVERLLADESRLFRSAEAQGTRAVERGKTPLIFTSRRLLSFHTMEEQLTAGQRISGFLARLVAAFDISPAFLIAKGGITSHDVLVQGLGIHRARVLGQAAAGVPVIRMPREHRWAGMPYVIFPGNVGNDRALRDVYRSLADLAG